MQYLVPLNHELSVQLVIHVLANASNPESCCKGCPIAKMCMQQCKTIASGIHKMVEEGTLPFVVVNRKGEAEVPAETPPAPMPKPAVAENEFEEQGWVEEPTGDVPSNVIDFFTRKPLSADEIAERKEV